MKPPEREEWVVVAEFTAFDAGLTADLAVSKLQGSGIPAQRIRPSMKTGREIYWPKVSRKRTTNNVAAG